MTDEKLKTISLKELRGMRKKAAEDQQPFGVTFHKNTVGNVIMFGVLMNDPELPAGIDAPQTFFKMEVADYVAFYEEMIGHPPTDEALERAPGVSKRVQKIIKESRKVADEAIKSIDKSESHEDADKAVTVEQAKKMVADAVAKLRASMERPAKPKFKPKRTARKKKG